MPNEFDDIRLRELIFFDRLAYLENITATAKELNIPNPTASRWLANLEARVGHALVHRTTRQVALTDQGVSFHHHVRAILSAVTAAKLAMHDETPTGMLRVSIPVPLGRMLAGSLVARFSEALPRVTLDIRFQNQRVDLLRDGIDVAIRGGALSDSDLIARKLAQVRLWIYVSEAHRGRPLVDIPLIGTPGDPAMLMKAGHGSFRPRAIVDDRTSICEAVEAGAGFGILPAFLGAPAQARGEVYRVSGEAVAEMPIHGIFLRAMRGDVRIRTFMDLLEESLSGVADPGDPGE